jgi:hypothetical protein
VTLGEIFHPVPAAQFLVDYFGARPLAVAGPASRFDFLKEGENAQPLAWDLEREVEAPVTFERSQGEPAEPHRGERDLLVLQIAGRTGWSTYNNEKEAAGEPDWSAAVTPGGALYVPRGWWRSTDCASPDAICCTFSIRNPTGADLLLWLADKVKDFDTFQTDIPRFAGPAAQAAYLTRLRRAFGGAFRAPVLLKAYSKRLDRLAPTHPVAVMEWGAGSAPDHSIELATPRRPRIFRHDPETICLWNEGVQILFPVDAAPLLQYVLDNAPFHAASFFREFAGEFDAEDLSGFLTALSSHRIVTVAPPHGGGPA